MRHSDADVFSGGHIHRAVLTLAETPMTSD